MVNKLPIWAGPAYPFLWGHPVVPSGVARRRKVGGHKLFFPEKWKAKKKKKKKKGHSGVKVQDGGGGYCG